MRGTVADSDPWSQANETAIGRKSKPMQTAEDAKAIVKSFYGGGARGESTSFADRLAENFELFVPPSLPWGGQFNKAQYFSILPRVASTLDFARMRYMSLTAEGQHVVALE